MTTAEGAEAYLDQDRSALDFSRFVPVRLEFERKFERINQRVPRPLLDAIKARARKRGIRYTRLIRELIERDVAAGDAGL